MPVFLFALSQTENIHLFDAILVFVIFHVLIYPASNGYNSYMDRDTESVGGIKNPLQPTKQLFYITVLMDAIAIVLSLLISYIFVLGIITYIIASRAYSYRGIRLKKYPLLGYFTVIVFQGAVTFFLVMHGCSTLKTLDVPVLGMLASSLLIGGFYPLTQIYQHKQDKEDGVTTISYLLGYKGSFIFTGIMYSIAMLVMAIYFFAGLDSNSFFILQIFLAPVFVFFLIWAKQVFKNTNNANFTNTMRMNIIASSCTNLAFLTLLILKQFE